MPNNRPPSFNRRKSSNIFGSNLKRNITDYYKLVAKIGEAGSFGQVYTCIEKKQHKEELLKLLIKQILKQMI